MNERYHIPESIKERIPSYFYIVLAGELAAAFHRNILEKYEDGFRIIENLSGTGGWYTALTETCRKLDMQWLLDYYEPLEWYDSDDFDYELIQNTLCVFGMADED